LEYREIKVGKAYKEQIQVLRDRKGIKAIKAGREIKAGKGRDNKGPKQQVGNSTAVDYIAPKVRLYMQRVKIK
jgi:hypothetical protein